MRTLIKGGTVLTAAETFVADVLVEDGKIAGLAKSFDGHFDAASQTEVIDATGKYVFPGGIDAHTHLDMPFGGSTSADDFETGTTAAAFGGTTTIVDCAIQYKGQDLRTAFDTWMKKADGRAVSDYAFHCIMTDVPDARLDEMN